MSEDLYAKVDLTKKVKFQTDEKEDTNADNNGDIDNVTIYDNCWAEGSTPPKSQDNTADDQRQTTSVNVSSGKRNIFKSAGVFLGLLCLVLLAAVIVLVVLWIQDKNSWRVSNEKLMSEKDQLLISSSEKESLNHNLTMKTSELEAMNNNLTNQRDELQTSYCKLESLNHNLTMKTSELEAMNNNLTNQRDELQTSYCKLESLNHNLTLKTSELEAMNNNLTNERDKLKSVIDTKCCPAQWNKVGNSCYFTSTSEETWNDSAKICENRDAHLVIISSEEEQKYLTTFGLRTWIGLTDQETEDDWKWVNGESVTKTFWRDRQPDNARNGEHCVELAGKICGPLENWNDLVCTAKRRFTCEKVLP